jgi:predicted nucleic acid-binding Zn ribbon protein
LDEAHAHGWIESHLAAILQTATGTAAMRATRIMGAGSKLVPTHQNVVVCVKGKGFTPADARAAGIRANAESQASQQ